MKSIDLFCASPASTAICSSMDQRSISRPGPKPIDRPVQRLGAVPRTRNTETAPCSSQLPFDPSKPFYHQMRGRKSTSSSAKQTDHQILRRKSSADVEDLSSSSKYLLSDRPFMDSDSEHGLVSGQVQLIRDDNKYYKRMNSDGFRGMRSLSTRAYQNPVYEPSSNGVYETSLVGVKNVAQKNASGQLSDHLNADQRSITTLALSKRQVVELRVSIHCKGCEGKLRRHISRMEGVTSFSIDLATKKVTVIGDVTPLGVLTSISKVKSAQFWPSPATSSSSSSSTSRSSPRISDTSRSYRVVSISLAK